MNMKVSDIVSICAIVAALGSAVSAPALEAVFPGHGTYIAGVLALAGLAAGQIIRVLTNKTGAAATSIITDAPVVSRVTGEQVASNLSSTSSLIPTKGKT